MNFQHYTWILGKGRIIQNQSSRSSLRCQRHIVSIWLIQLLSFMNISCGLGVMARTQRFSMHTRMPYGQDKELWPGHKSKSELARAVPLVRDTSSRYDLAICYASWRYSILFRSYKPDMNARTNGQICLPYSQYSRHTVSIWFDHLEGFMNIFQMIW